MASVAECQQVDPAIIARSCLVHTVNELIVNEEGRGNKVPMVFFDETEWFTPVISKEMFNTCSNSYPFIFVGNENQYMEIVSKSGLIDQLDTYRVQYPRLEGKAGGLTILINVVRFCDDGYLELFQYTHAFEDGNVGVSKLRLSKPELEAMLIMIVDQITMDEQNVSTIVQFQGLPPWIDYVEKDGFRIVRNEMKVSSFVKQSDRILVRDPYLLHKDMIAFHVGVGSKVDKFIFERNDGIWKFSTKEKYARF
jgi:hypothetical protein